MDWTSLTIPTGCAQYRTAVGLLLFGPGARSNPRPIPAGERGFPTVASSAASTSASQHKIMAYYVRLRLPARCDPCRLLYSIGIQERSPPSCRFADYVKRGCYSIQHSVAVASEQITIRSTGLPIDVVNLGMTVRRVWHLECPQVITMTQ